MEKNPTVLMNRYELGRMFGQGTFAKVYHGRNLTSSQSVAIKVIDKEKVGVSMIDQIKREISMMCLVRHPNVVQLHEVMASNSKIYLTMEYVQGGELFARLAHGRLKEDVARRYFHQLIGAVNFCHSHHIFHRDLKPENILIDKHGNLKVSDFGLSVLAECQQDELLHTTSCMPAYIAPEIINKKGYDGAKADIWSCGVILFVLLAGYLPFHDANLMGMCCRISRRDVKYPRWFSSDLRRFMSKLLDPNPNTRFTIEKLVEHPWFKKGYKPAAMLAQPHGSKSFKDVQVAFSTAFSTAYNEPTGSSLQPTR